MPVAARAKENAVTRRQVMSTTVDVAKAKQDSQARPYEWFRRVA